MNDLIFVIRSDGSYEQVPNRNLRAQENFSDNFVVIANRVGVVKAKIRLLSRTDKVEVKYLVPTSESVESFIGDQPYFQDYADANVWRGAIPKKFLQEISMSYAGNVEVSFSFLKLVTDIRATNYLGDLTKGELPNSATTGDYFVIKYSSYTKGEITWTYGQTAIWDGGWIKGGTYQVLGTTQTHRMNVEATLIGEQVNLDVEEVDEVMQALGEMSEDIEGIREDITDIVNGDIVVEKARADQYGQEIDQIYLTNVLPSTNYENDEINVRLYLKDGLNETRDKPSFVINKATAVLAGVMSATDKARLDELWAILQNSDDPTFVDTIRELLEIFENYPEGMDIVAMFATKADKTTVNAELALKSDKVETRAIGEETITYTGDKVTQIESDTVLTEIFYKPNGEIDYITEFYKGDSKTYKTTLTKVEGIITKTTKELI